MFTCSDFVKSLFPFIYWTFVFPGILVTSLRAADLVKARDALEHPYFSDLEKGQFRYPGHYY